MHKFNLIFPMAGEGSRFNYKFKPFLQISDQYFIELSYKYFKPFENQILKTYFIVTQEQNNKFNIQEKLSEIFNNFELIILEHKTIGPYQTIFKAIKKHNIQGAAFICDCDHSINISPIINNLEKLLDYDVILPIWDLKQEDLNSWSKVYLDSKNNILGFSEKELLDISPNYFGVIGCTYLKNLNFFNNLEYENISQGLNLELKITTVKIEEAEFFGDPKRLKNCINQRRNKSTIFCDLDGTLIIHEANPGYKSTKLLPGTLEQIKYWKENNYYIVLTTSRNNRRELIKLLEQLKITYDLLITGLPSGPRYLINDIKPIQELIPQANSINLKRNIGIKNINLGVNKYEIIHIFKGNSFSKTMLIKKKKLFCVRKYIFKNSNNHRHYQKLKRQFNDLQRFNFYSDNICPKILDEFENDYLYYYDMEYLENYSTFDKIVNFESKIENLLIQLNSSIYSIRKLNTHKNWISNYLFKKIKISEYAKLDPVIEQLLNLKKININGVNYKGIKELMINDFSDLNPNYLSIIHGDLTFENILYNSNTKSFKLIDMDGSEYIDAPELDFGKILQSLLSKYEIWSNQNNLITKLELNNNILNTLEFTNLENYNSIFKNLKIWDQILGLNGNIELLKKKGIFFMTTHLFRMIPYKFKINLEQTIYTIKEIIIWMNQIY